MAKALADAGRPQALIAVPLHRARLRTRGYDQALELAKPLARVLHLPLLPDTLRRVRATAPQSELDAARRKRNLDRKSVVSGTSESVRVELGGRRNIKKKNTQ